MRSVEVAAIVLAAGFSRRLGRPKQELLFQGEALLDRTVRILLAAEARRVLVVTREDLVTSPFVQQHAKVLINARASEGMASSIRAGVAALAAETVAGTLLVTCDQPFLRPEHLRALVAESRQVTGSWYAGRVGVPAYFPAHSFPGLMALRGDAGARSLLQGAASIPDETLALDIDTEEDLLLAQQRVRLAYEL